MRDLTTDVRAFVRMCACVVAFPLVVLLVVWCHLFGIEVDLT